MERLNSSAPAPFSIVTIVQSPNGSIAQFLLLTDPSIATRLHPSYPANSELLRGYGESFRTAPLHCGGRSHTSRQKHAVSHSGRALECAAGDGARVQSISQRFL